jgi:hypothetical protein
MVLVDTSAWIEFLRDGDRGVADAVEALLDGVAVVCDVVVMEVLAGARDEAHLESLRRLLARAVTAPVTTVDFEVAAQLFRTGRRRGVTVRSLVDCLVAAVAIRLGVPVLCRDRDFAALAAVSELRCQRPIA